MFSFSGYEHELFEAAMMGERWAENEIAENKLSDEYHLWIYLNIK